MKRKSNIQTNSCNECNINTLTIFNKLTIDEVNYINFEKTCYQYKKNTILYNEGSRISGCYCVHEGIIKLYKTGIEGREHIIRFARKGDLIGYRSLFSGELACHSAKVLEDAVVCFIPGEVMFNLIEQNSKFALEILRLACHELDVANSFIRDMAQKTVKERLAEILLILKEDFGLDENNYLKINLTREDLANIIGTATESVIRLLGEFKEQNIIDIEGRKIKLINLNALQKISEKSA